MSKKQKSNLGQVLAGGAVGGAAAQLITSTLLRTTSPLIKNVGLVAVGAILPEFLKMAGVAEAGAAMIGVGAAGLVTEFIPGTSTPPPATSGIMRDFDNSLGQTPSASFYQRMIDPASDQALSGIKKKRKGIGELS